MESFAAILREMIRYPDRLIWVGFALCAALVAAGYDLRIRRLVRRSEAGHAFAGGMLRRHAAAHALRLMALAAIGIAAVDVRWGGETVSAGRSNRQVVFLVDRSRSMLAQDVEPSRFELARESIVRSIEQSPGSATALVSFAGDVVVETRLTRNPSIVLKELATLDPHTNVSFGSQLEAGMRAAAACFARSFPGGKHLIVFTDGESHDTIDVDAEPFTNISVTIVGIGDSRQGGRIPLRANTPPQDAAQSTSRYLTHKGKTVWTKANLAQLARLADDCGGTFLHLAGSSETTRLMDIFARDEKSLSHTLPVSTARPLYVPLAALAFLLLLGDAWLVSRASGKGSRPARRWRQLGRRSAAVLALVGMLGGAHSHHPPSSTGRQWTTRQLAQIYNLGVEAYHRNEFHQARDYFFTVHRHAEGRLQHRAAYNMANARYRLVAQGGMEKAQAVSDLKKAIDLYRECIREQERPADARVNVQLTYALLKQIENQPPSSPPSSQQDAASETRSRSESNGPGGGAGADPSDFNRANGNMPGAAAAKRPPANQPLSDEQADQMLRQAEQRARRRPPAQDVRPGAPPRFPW